MNGRFVIAAFIIIISIQPGIVFSEESRNHTVGMELVLAGIYQGFSDPYSMPAGIGAFYQYRFSGRHPVSVSADIEWYGFSPMENQYDFSRMIIPSIGLGYSFIKPLGKKSFLFFTPAAAAGQYFRSFERDGKTESGSRPHLRGGLEIALETEKHMVFSFSFFYGFFLDNTLISLPGIRNRVGYAF